MADAGMGCMFNLLEVGVPVARGQDRDAMTFVLVRGSRFFRTKVGRIVRAMWATSL
jgi:hypothetical protein